MNKKAQANIISYILFILIAIIIFTMVATESINIVRKHQETYKFNLMIDSISYLNNNIILVSHERFSKKEIIINNPEEITIDCENNRITGSLSYSLEFRTDQNTEINGITVYNKINNLYFDKNISDNELIYLDCTTFTLNKGKNLIDIYYITYEDDKVHLDINRPTPNITG